MKNFLLFLCLTLLLVLPGLATLQSIGGVMPWPPATMVPPSAQNRNFNTYAAMLLDATGEKAAFIVQVPAGCTTIQKIGFRLGTVTTGDTLKVGVYTVDAADGNATTTAYGGMTAGTAVVANSDDNKWELVDNGDASSTPGDVLGVVIEFDSYVSGNLNIAYGDTSNLGSLFPYVDLYTGTWAKGTGAPTVTFECQSGVYYPITGAWPAATLTDRAYDTVGGENDEGGNIHNQPFKGRAVGAWFYGDTNANFTIKLYDSDGSTVLASVVYDTSVQYAATPGIKYVRFTTFGGTCSAPGCVLSANTNYRITILAADSTGGTMGDLDVDATVGVAMMGALPGGSAIHYTTRDGGGSWTETTTRRAMIGLLIDQLDDGASAGGGTRVY